jgi:DNA-binding MurR/RpiR family transcriptional regulator
MNGLETAARNFAISAKAGRLLERHRATVLMLRAKDATFSQIQDLLAQHGVTVSESSITRFCRKHLAEIQRLRLQLEQEVDLPSGSPPLRATVPTDLPLTQSRKMRDLRGPV